eukprot:5183986-Karenia_brevis.AAC.1
MGLCYMLFHEGFNSQDHDIQKNMMMDAGHASPAHLVSQIPPTAEAALASAVAPSAVSAAAFDDIHASLVLLCLDCYSKDFNAQGLRINTVWAFATCTSMKVSIHIDIQKNTVLLRPRSWLWLCRRTELRLPSVVLAFSLAANIDRLENKYLVASHSLIASYKDFTSQAYANTITYMFVEDLFIKRLRTQCCELHCHEGTDDVLLSMQSGRMTSCSSKIPKQDI